MANIRVTVTGDEEIVRKFANTAGRMGKWRSHAQAEAGLVQAAVVPLTPAFSGDLRASWESDIQVGGTTFEEEIGSPLDYAEPVERGRAPGSAAPPTTAISSWVASTLGAGVSAYVIARAIGRKGIPPKEMLKKAFDGTRPARHALRASVMQRLVADS